MKSVPRVVPMSMGFGLATDNREVTIGRNLRPVYGAVRSVALRLLRKSFTETGMAILKSSASTWGSKTDPINYQNVGK